MSAPEPSVEAALAALKIAAPRESLLALVGGSDEALEALWARGALVRDARGFSRYNPLLPPPASPEPAPSRLLAAVQAGLAAHPDDPGLALEQIRLLQASGDPEAAGRLMALCDRARMAGVAAELARLIVETGMGPTLLTMARGPVMRVLIAGGWHRAVAALLGDDDALFRARIALAERRPMDVEGLLEGLDPSDPEVLGLRTAAALDLSNDDEAAALVAGVELETLPLVQAYELGVLRHRLASRWGIGRMSEDALEALRALAERTDDARILVHVVYAGLREAVRRGDVPVAERHLAELRDRWVKDVPELKSALDYTEAELGVLTGNHPRAVAAMTDQRSPPPPWQIYWPVARVTTRVLQGDIRAALEESRKLAYTPLTAQLHAMLGDLEIARDMLEAPESRGYSSEDVEMLRIEVARLLGQPRTLSRDLSFSQPVAAYQQLVQGSLAMDAGDLAGALEVCEAGLERVRRYELWEVGVRLLLLRADLEARQGDRRAALAWLERAEARISHPLNFDANLIFVARAALVEVPPPREMLARIAAQGDYQSLALAERTDAALPRAAREFLAGVPESAVALARSRFPSGQAHGALVVHTKADWFQTPQGEVVSLTRYGSTRRVLAALAEARLATPGESMSADALVEAGWPGERILPEAASTRMYTAIRKLRRLGVGDVLETVDSGYRLSPEVEVIRVTGAP